MDQVAGNAIRATKILAYETAREVSAYSLSGDTAFIFRSEKIWEILQETSQNSMCNIWSESVSVSLDSMD